MHEFHVFGKRSLTGCDANFYDVGVHIGGEGAIQCGEIAFILLWFEFYCVGSHFCDIILKVEWVGK